MAGVARHTAADPRTLAVWIERFAADCLARDYSARTVEARLCSLRAFVAWCEDRSLSRPQEVTVPVLERYRRALYHYRVPATGRPLSVATQRNRLTAVKVFFRYLARERVILYNPAAELELPRLHKRLPKAILTVDDVEAVCRQTLLHGALGIRDRAMIETLYATGIRRQELTQLDVYDVDLEQGTLMVREGKGKKDRLLPIGRRACAWIDRYVTDVRPQLVVAGPDDQALFLDNKGTRFTPGQLSDKVKHYLDAAGVHKPGACHLFRHTMATLMLENGADLRFIQAMLGHADISTTTIYTQVSIRALKEVYARTHPAQHVPRARRQDDAHDANEKILTADDVLDALEQEALNEAEDN